MTRILPTAIFLTLFSQTALGDDKRIYAFEVIEYVGVGDDIEKLDPNSNNSFYFSIGDGYLKCSEYYFGGESAEITFLGKANKELFSAAIHWGSYSFKDGNFFFANSTYFSSWAGRAKCEKL